MLEHTQNWTKRYIIFVDTTKEGYEYPIMKAQSDNLEDLIEHAKEHSVIGNQVMIKDRKKGSPPDNIIYAFGFDYLPGELKNKIQI